MLIEVIDPSRSVQRSLGALVAGADGRLSLSVPPARAEAGESLRTGRFISPGWVDLHAHVYHAVTPISVDPDRAGLDQGVHLLVDAGSAGAYTLPGLVEFVHPRSHTEIRAWINIGAHGLVHLRETSRPEFMDVDAAIGAIADAGGFVCGVKVRASGAIVGSMGLLPLELGRLVARETGLPLMVHIGEAPPLVEDVLELLDAGDVVTHCFHGKVGAPWRSDGSPAKPLGRALDRGVLLDVGHGAASFSAAVARRAVTAGHSPHSISTDVHVRNIAGPVHDLATVMTKMLTCGMPLAAVIAAVTTSPRAAIAAEEPWIGADGTIRHATVFDVTGSAPATRTYVDSDGATQEPALHIVPVATIADGAWRDCRRPQTVTPDHRHTAR